MLEVGWWGCGDLSKNILKPGWVKAKLFMGGGGRVEGVTTPAAPPPEKFNHTLGSKYDNLMFTH